jgi:hypothetical protein
VYNHYQLHLRDMGKRAVVNVAEVTTCAENNIPVQASKILLTIYPTYRVNPTISRRCDGDILTEEQNWERERHGKCEMVEGRRI